MMYAILHKPSGRFLPQSKYYRGGTYTEVLDNRPPRLFSTKTAAKNCLNHWLAGILHVSYGPVNRGDFFDDDIRNEEIIPQPHRKAEDMEIVQVRLEVVE